MFFYIDWSVCQPSECFMLSSMLLVNRVHRLFVEIGMNSLLFLCFRLRMFCQHLISRRWFDNSVLFFIALNCITLAMERPDIPPHSTVSMHLVLTVSSCIHPYILTVSHWLWSDLTFLPTELWACAVCQPCLFLYPYIHDCITLVTWHSSPQNCEHVLCVNLVSSYIHTSMTVSHWWPDIAPHRTVSMYCVSTLSLLICIHPWLYHTSCGAT